MASGSDGTIGPAEGSYARREDGLASAAMGEVKMHVSSAMTGRGADRGPRPVRQALRFGGAAAVLLVLAVAGGGAQAAPDPRPSFDCAKASSPDEQAICANPYLARLDVLMSEAYGAFTPEFGDKRTIGKWLLQDRSACGADEACIAAVQVNAIDTYGGTAAWAKSYADGLIGAKAAAFADEVSHRLDQPLPRGMADCAITHIAELTTRFGDPLEGADSGAGVALHFTNDGWEISYDMVDALYDAKVGDPVIVCLAWVPRDCPKDDTRGRVYYSLDARTGRAWSMPDSQHNCGGA